jgi:AAHS family 4-hydroxybenzoate transporter-like MFS transporter
MIDGYDLFMVSFLAPMISKELHLSLVNMGLVFAAGLAGSMAGGLLMGPAADRVGRRPVLLVTLALAGAGTLLCSQAHSFEALAVLRLLTGFALGGLLATIIPLVAEHVRRERRSASVTLMFIGYPFGAVVGGAITAVLISHGWRALFLGAGTVTLLLMPIGLLLNETSHPPSRESAWRRSRWTLIDLFTEGRFWSTVIASFGVFCLLLVAYLLNNWTPLIAAQSGLSHAKAAWCGVLLNLGGVVGALISTFVVARFGVFKIVTWMVASGSLAVGCLGYLFGSGAGLLAGLAIVGILVIGGQQNVPAISVQLYPQRMRAAGVGWQFAAGRLGSILGPIVGGRLLSAAVPVERLFMWVAIPTVLSAGAYAVVGLLQKSRIESSKDP